MKNPKYLVRDGMNDTDIECDSVRIQFADGRYIELQYRKSDGEISLNGSGRLRILPNACNVVRVEVDR